MRRHRKLVDSAAETDDSTTPLTDVTPLTVLTLNTWTDKHKLAERMSSIADLIYECSLPDVVALQEIFSSGAQDILRARLRHVIPHMCSMTAHECPTT